MKKIHADITVILCATCTSPPVKNTLYSTGRELGVEVKSHYCLGRCGHDDSIDVYEGLTLLESYNRNPATHIAMLPENISDIILNELRYLK